MPTSIGQYFDDIKSRSKIDETSIELQGDHKRRTKSFNTHSGLRGTTLPTCIYLAVGQYFDDKKNRSKINETSIELFGLVSNQGQDKLCLGDLMKLYMKLKLDF